MKLCETRVQEVKSTDALLKISKIYFQKLCIQSRAMLKVNEK